MASVEYALVPHVSCDENDQRGRAAVMRADECVSGRPGHARAVCVRAATAVAAFHKLADDAFTCKAVQRIMRHRSSSEGDCKSCKQSPSAHSRLTDS